MAIEWLQLCHGSARPTVGTRTRRLTAGWAICPSQPDLEDDLAGLVGCARKHGLRLARLRKRQE